MLSVMGLPESFASITFSPPTLSETATVLDAEGDAEVVAVVDPITSDDWLASFGLRIFKNWVIVVTQELLIRMALFKCFFRLL